MHPGAHAASAPDRPAVVMSGLGEVLTYRELDERSLRLARLFASRGLREGDRVAILAENHVRYFEVYWAAIRSGLYLTAVNRHLRRAEAVYVVQNSEARALVTTAAFAELAEAMLPQLDDCPVRLMLDGAAGGFEPYEDALASHPADPVAGGRRGNVMLYSSGTTGRPKGVRHPLPDVPVEAGGNVSPLARGYLGIRRDVGVPEPRPALPRRPVGLVRRGPRARRPW